MLWKALVSLISLLLLVACGGSTPKNTEPGPTTALGNDVKNQPDATSNGTPTTVISPNTQTDTSTPSADTKSNVALTIGNACSSNANCGAGELCLTDAKYPGGYCTKANCVQAGCPLGSKCYKFGDDANAESYCFRDCADASQCRQGYSCDQHNSCYPETPTNNNNNNNTNPGTASIGDACSKSSDCKDTGAVCYPEDGQSGPTGFVNGYCVMTGCSAQKPCPGGSTCVTLGDTNMCLANCAGHSDCRSGSGYSCFSVDGGGVCFPGCGDTVSCPNGYVCSPDEICVGPKYACNAQNPTTGICPDGLSCNQGVCGAFNFVCDQGATEPNNDKSTATQYGSPQTQQFQICQGDEDWYKVTIPAGKFASVDLSFVHQNGDLDLEIYDEAGNILGSRNNTVCCLISNKWYLLPPDSCSSSNGKASPAADCYNGRTYETNYETLTALASTKGSRTMYYRVRGYKTATNNYQLKLTMTDYKDIPDGGDPYCHAHLPLEECRGVVNGQQKLHHFPMADPQDPYLGGGYVFDTVANYRFARMELIMQVRYAIRQVQLRFPGTKPLGLIDICQRDGITPGYDIGSPRHPETTHDQGGNIDIAYFQTGSNNHARIVCGPNEGDNDGSFCTSVANHVMDIPRTAYFMAKLVENPRVRVIGVDQLLAPLIKSGLDQLAAQGAISSTLATNTKNKLAFGSGWPFHHHHMHLSFYFWSQAKPGDPAPEGCGLQTLPASPMLSLP